MIGKIKANIIKSDFKQKLALAVKSNVKAGPKAKIKDTPN